MQALGPIVTIKPIAQPNSQLVFHNPFKTPIKRGIVVSVGNAAPEELQPGQTVAYRAGNHPKIGEYIFVKDIFLEGIHG